MFTWVRVQYSSRRAALSSLTSAYGGYAAATEQRYPVLLLYVKVLLYMKYILFKPTEARRATLHSPKVPVIV